MVYKIVVNYLIKTKLIKYNSLKKNFCKLILIEKEFKKFLFKKYI